jgi:hypothetical protein
MSYHGNHVGKLDALGRPHIKKPNPKKELMRKYWYEGPLSQMFQPYTDTDFCMACGIKTTTDRAHILAQSEKGSHQFNNIHLLCKDCHGESEMMEGLHYWAWLMVKRELYQEGYFTPYEMDYAVDEKDKLIKYFMEEAIEEKVSQKMSVVSKYLWFQDGILLNPTQAMEVARENEYYRNISVKQLLKTFFVSYLLPFSLKKKGESFFEEIFKVDEWLHMNIDKEEGGTVNA